MLFTQEHYDLLAQFERAANKMLHGSFRFDREPKELWPKGYIYQHGETNNAFLAYRLGYAFGKTVGREEVEA